MDSKMANNWLILEAATELRQSLLPETNVNEVNPSF